MSDSCSSERDLKKARKSSHACIVSLTFWVFTSGPWKCDGTLTGNVINGRLEGRMSGTFPVQGRLASLIAFGAQEKSTLYD